jgi:succinoglycan biosynthesis transport protein ExoP
MQHERNYYPETLQPQPMWQFAPPATAAPVDNKRQWNDLWRSIRKRQWWILAIAFIVSLAAAGIAYTMQPVYRSTATVLIESGKAKILSIEEVYSGVSQDREYYQTQVEILRSRDIALRTVLNAKLWNAPEFNPRLPPTGVVSWIKGQVARLLPKAPEPAPQTPRQLADATVGKFIGATSIEPVRLSQLVKVSFEATDPTLAANMANAIAQSYIDADRDGRLKLTQDVNVLLQDRMSALRDKLLASEQQLQTFREKEGLVNLSGSAQGLAGQNMGDISQRLLAARVKRTELESAYQEVARSGGGDFSSVPAVVGNGAVGIANARVSSAAAKLEELSHTFGPNHASIIQAKAELDSAQRSLRSQVQAIVGSMKRDYLAARETERSLEAALKDARGTVQGVNRQEFQLGVLEREVQANKQLYELFLSRVKETSISSNLQAAVARVVDSASVAGVPVRPNKPQIVGLAFVLSLIAAAIGSVLLDAMDNTLRGADDTESRLRQHVLATLPTIGTVDHVALPRMYLDMPDSNHAEGIRTARSGVLLSSSEMTQRTLLVTSTFEGEGKTTVCTNLALAHAQTKRTVLIDANMRDPQIGQRLGLSADAKGLSDLIQGTSDIRECLHAVEGSTLLVMPAGDVSVNPQDLLLSRRFHDLLASLATRVEIIVIDSPPVSEVSDALILSAQVSDTIYVVKAMQTPAPAARKGIDRLQHAGANVLGVVVNESAVPDSRRSTRVDAAPSSRRVGGFPWSAGRRKDAREATTTAAAAAENLEGRGGRGSRGVSEAVFATVVEPQTQSHAQG